MIPSAPNRRHHAFTLIELIVVVAIIGLMVSFAVPATSVVIRRAQSSACVSHLHGIGVAVLASVSDNNGMLPKIDQAATSVYPPPGTVPGIVGVLGRYGVTTNDIQCPLDLARGTASSFQQYQSSYEWNPIFDDGSYPPASVDVDKTTLDVNASRIRLCTDFTLIHNQKVNALYADGHVDTK